MATYGGNGTGLQQQAPSARQIRSQQSRPHPPTVQGNANKWSFGPTTLVEYQYKKDLNLNDSNKDFYVNPFNTDAQGRMSDLIESRYDFIKEKSEPLESALFKYSSYDNHELYNNYVSEAIPKVQQSLQQERGLMDRTLAATGSSFSDQESVLRDKLTSLQSQESITQAANQIRTRLKDREQQIAFGSAPATTNMQGGI